MPDMPGKLNLPCPPGLAIVRERGLAERFPPSVLAEADEVPGMLDAAAIQHELSAGRKDLRTRRAITIDGEDARDFDDAVDVEELTDGRYRLGVHIADVAHYVQEGSEIDREAQKRATSVYLADLVLPMLPTRLSNGICSLNPEVDRLSLSVILTIGPDGDIEQGEVLESIIRSHARTTYNEVRKALESQESPPGRYSGFLDDLRRMKRLAEVLESCRKRRGAIDLDLTETHVVVDSDGQPTLIEPYPASFANRIIESFMIAANEYIAHRFFYEKLPFLFRVHELPDKEKLDRFAKAAANFGVRLRLRGMPSPGQLAAALEQVRSEPVGTTLSELLLRSMAKARYCEENLGHFGLASEYYCHFTSPIRRYPDLFIHRVIKASLRGHVERKRWMSLAPVLALQCSEMERVAMAAERDSVDQMSAIYMSSRLGEIFSGVVARFGPAGFYVRLPDTVEGLVPYRSLPLFLAYDEENLVAADRGGRLRLGLGDPVEVQLARADVTMRQIDFELISPAVKPLKPQAGKKKGRTRQGAAIQKTRTVRKRRRGK